MAESRARTSGSMMLRNQDRIEGTLWLIVVAGVALAFGAIFLQ